jgi:hypothetical protein
LIEKAQETDYDAFYFPRRHWADLEMKIPAEKDHIWWPDWQCRLMRVDFPRIHMRRYVHEVAQGVRRTMHVKGSPLHHFNCYYKKLVDYDWNTMLKFYDELKAREIKEKGQDIWPDKGEII